MRTIYFGITGTVLISVLVILLHPNAVRSQELLGGSLNTKVLGSIDRSIPVTIHYQNDAELKERLAQFLKNELLKHKLAIVSNTHHEIIIETEIGGETEAEKNWHIRYGGGTSINIKHRVTGDKRKFTPQRGRYRLTMRLVNQGKFEMRWGTADAAFCNPNRETAVAFLIERLAQAIGQKFENRPLRNN